MATTELKGVNVLSREEGLRILDEKAQHYLGISGEEFVRRWDSGYYANSQEQSDLVRLVMLLPLVR
jgi:hypothetical protein